MQTKIQKEYAEITFTFLLFSKLPKTYAKITQIIRIAPLRGAVGIANVIFVYVFGNFENSKKVNEIVMYFLGNLLILKNFKNIIFVNFLFKFWIFTP